MEVKSSMKLLQTEFMPWMTNLKHRLGIKTPTNDLSVAGSIVMPCAEPKNQVIELKGASIKSNCPKVCIASHNLHERA